MRNWKEEKTVNDISNIDSRQKTRKKVQLQGSKTKKNILRKLLRL